MKVKCRVELLIRLSKFK